MAAILLKATKNVPLAEDQKLQKGAIYSLVIQQGPERRGLRVRFLEARLYKNGRTFVQVPLSTLEHLQREGDLEVHQILAHAEAEYVVECASIENKRLKERKSVQP